MFAWTSTVRFHQPVTAAGLKHAKFSRQSWKMPLRRGYKTEINVVTDGFYFRERRRVLHCEGRSLGFVPTMGALHDGHLALIRQAAAENHDVCVSIYVNPTQFGVNEDLDAYPKTWDADLKKLESLNQILEESGSVAGRITHVFKPSTKEMYPGLPPTSEVDGQGSFVTITPLGSMLEGASRPVFFRGVATVCMKLFNIVQADQVYFGQKDIQQVVLINRMMRDFHINTKLRICGIMREPDGLAMSSRNVYLGQRRRAIAPVLHQALKAAAEACSEGRRKRSDVVVTALNYLKGVQESQEGLPPSERALFEIDYISLADPLTMEEVEYADPNRGAVLSGAVVLKPIEEAGENEDTGSAGGGLRPVRLIDNCLINRENALQTMETGRL